MSRTPRQFSAVRTEGGLLPQDLLARIQGGDPDLAGTKAETYHLGPHERIGEAANRSWSRLVATWRAFQEALAKESASSLATGVTRDRWLLPLFQELGYGRLPRGTAIEVEGKRYAVSHTWHHSPIHLLGCRIELDRRQKGVAGAAKSSPHGLVQELLNRSDDHLWGFVTNGYRLRILRDHHSLTRQAYVEFDLQTIMDGEQYSEFLLLWLVCHQSRVELPDREDAKPEDCWLETWVNTSREEGVRALDKLRDGVEKAIESFGTGFLRHRANARLKDALENGELDKQEYYRQILRLVYRLIFLFVAEERDALLDPNASEEVRERYRRYYATRRLRDLADRRRGGPHSDLWRALALVMEQLDDGNPALGLPALGSRLWGPTACPWLMDAECANEHVLGAIRHLSHIQEGKTRYPVNWRNVGADELGSIYESLLERHPRMNKEAGTFELHTAAGHERKTSGSYYTPTSLVDCLLDSALDPVLDEACKKPNAEEAVLDLKVCDPACGSGHFLVAAARRIAKRLASVRSGDDEPSPRDVQKALRDVVGHCIYGVDLNPMAVELCKVSLWMEAIEPGKPLSFLDSHIQCGNALLGATPALMARGIPNDAFKPIEGDDKDVAKRLKKRNRDERKGQTTLFGLFGAEPAADLDAVSKQAAGVEKAADDSITAVRDKERRWDRLSRSAQFKDAWFRADAWCAAFVWPKQPGDLENGAITQDTWRRIEKDVSAAGQVTRKTVRELAREYRFFHWHLAFPTAFGELRRDYDEGDTIGWAGGFDVVLGNPPWERIKLQEKEFFSTRAPEIAQARNASTRKKAIAKLEQEDPTLWTEWKAALREADGASHLVRQAGRYPLCGRGDINTYSIFAELNRTLLASTGRAGFIVPSGIATDATTQHFFKSLITSRSLVCFWGFENEGKLFKGIDHRVNFCILAVSSREVLGGAEFASFLRHPDLLRGAERRFTLSSDDIALLNPNTGTCPVFRSGRDAEITKAIYRRVPVLVREAAAGRPEENPWGVSFLRMLDMANDSGLFRTRDELEAEGWRLAGNIFERGGSRMLPLYEAKMVHLFDHRFGDFGRVQPGQRAHILPPVPVEDREDPRFSPLPRYWVHEAEVEKRLSDRWDRDWLLGWRDVTDARSSVRTVIAGVLPRVAVNHKFLLMLPGAEPGAALLANLAAFALDYCARQKLGGTSLNYFTMRQLPVLVPDRFRADCPWSAGASIWSWMRPRVLELSFTAWDLAPFARDHGCDGPPFRWDEERRSLLRCELDAAFFHLYGIDRDDVDYIMETFPIVKRRDEAVHGDYRTKLQILDIYDAMQRAIDTGEPYQTLLDPPPAHASVAHPESTRPEWAAAPEHRPPALPAMPSIVPEVDPAQEPFFVVWALLHASGGAVRRTELARAFVLWSHPSITARLAPGHLATATNEWASKVGQRSVASGTLAQALTTLADRGGITLTTDEASRSLVTTSDRTPAEDKLDAWYRFEARLALDVLAAQPPAGIEAIDASMSGEDRTLLEARGA
ncbi:MAG TPA: SAM-dependent DNA methyltransferase [Polyangiaceae bacterium]|nr:SAM-dependent DNA methyltransferase [Polyangiaceae bacterium]